MDSHSYRVRWGDLISPRAMFDFTLADAWGALPTLLAMGGFFLGGLAIILLIKWILKLIFLRKEYHTREVLVRDGAGGTARWVEMPVNRLGSIIHLVIETLFIIAFFILVLFTFAIGNFNLWTSGIGTVGISLVGTYIFGIGLQQVGAGYFFLITNYMSYGEYWEMSGNQTVGGRVSYINPFFVEFEILDPEAQSAVYVRVPMTQIIGGMWVRNPLKELTARPLSRYCKGPDCAPVPQPTSKRIRMKERFI